MFDPATLGAALTSLKTVMDLAKNANDAQLTIKISSEIANIQSRLLIVQQQALELQTENAQLEKLNWQIDKMKQHFGTPCDSTTGASISAEDQMARNGIAPLV